MFLMCVCVCARALRCSRRPFLVRTCYILGVNNGPGVAMCSIILSDKYHLSLLAGRLTLHRRTNRYADSLLVGELSCMRHVVALVGIEYVATQIVKQV